MHTIPKLKSGEKMSILQEYENHRNYLGKEVTNAISEYICYLEKRGIDILYSDVIYKKEEWQKFENWYKKVYNIKYGKSSKGNRKI